MSPQPAIMRLLPSIAPATMPRTARDHHIMLIVPTIPGIVTPWLSDPACRVQDRGRAETARRLTSCRTTGATFVPSSSIACIRLAWGIVPTLSWSRKRS